MTTTRPPHPVEAFEGSIIDNAAYWTACQHRGAFDRQKSEQPTREKAVEVAHLMLADCPHRSVLIYAVSAEGRQALAETVRRRAA